MPSVNVSWNGQCSDLVIQKGLIGKLMQLAELSHARIDPPAPIKRYDGEVIKGRILLWRDLFESGDYDRAACFLEVNELRLNGLEFSLIDPRNLYRGDDRISFVFASRPSRAANDGTLVRIDGADLCQKYDEPEIAAADYFVRPPGIHLRYYFEQWIDKLLGYVKHFHIPDLSFWRYEDLPGYDQFAGLDPNNVDQRDLCWEAIVAAFNSEIGDHHDEAVDLRSRLDHMQNSGECPLDWFTKPYAPLETKLTVSPALAPLMTDAGATSELVHAARLAIMRAGQGYYVDGLSLDFRKSTVVITTRLVGGRKLIIDAALAA